MTLIYDNLAVIMAAFLCVGFMSNYKTLTILVSISIVMVVLGLTGRELYFYHITSMPSALLRDLISRSSLLVSSLGILAILLRQIFVQSSGKDRILILASINHVLAYSGLMGLFLITSLVSCYLVIPAVVAVAILSSLDARLHSPSMMSACALKAIGEETKSGYLIKSIIRYHLFILTAVIFYHIFSRLNGEHILVSWVRSWPYSNLALLTCLLFLSTAFSIKMSWYRVAIIFIPLVQPITFFIDNTPGELNWSAPVLVSSTVTLGFYCAYILSKTLHSRRHGRISHG